MSGAGSAVTVSGNDERHSSRKWLFGRLGIGGFGEGGLSWLCDLVIRDIDIAFCWKETRFQ